MRRDGAFSDLKVMLSSGLLCATLPCLLSLTLVFGVLISPAASQNDADAPAKTPFDAQELDSFMAVVRSKDFDVSKRRDIARAILRRGWPEGFEALAGELKLQSDPTTVQAIAQALASVDITPPEDFAQPLYDLLEKADPKLIEDIAKALGRYQSPELRTKLAEVALDSTQMDQLRIGALATLGHHRSKSVMQTLVKLVRKTKPAAPDPVREAAFTALSQLTGITDYGNNVKSWVDFEKKLRRLSEDEWQRQLMNNLQSRVRELERKLADSELKLNAQIAQLEQHVKDAYQLIYRTTATEQQPEMLKNWLTGDQPSLRELALKLIKREVTESIRPTFAKSLLDPLRAVLDDEESESLLMAVDVLGLMRDQTAAEVVAKRLALGNEKRPAVISQYLLMMRDVPQSAAVEPALGYLSDPVFRAEAAAFLATAADQEPTLLSDVQVDDALTQIRTQLDASGPQEPVPPAFVALMGRLSSKDADWQLIEQWLDSKVEAVRFEAARAWSRSGRSLAQLAAHADDAIIQPIFIAAAERRGDQLGTMVKLIGLKLSDEQLAKSRHRALEALAGKVSPAEVHNAIAGNEDEPALFEKMFTMAITKLTESLVADNKITSPVLRDLILARAEMKLLNDDPEGAFSDFQRLSVEKELSAEMKPKVSFGQFQCLLSLNMLESAIKEAKTLISMISPSATEPLDTKVRLAQVFFDSADRSVKAEQFSRAKMLIDTLHTLVGPTVPPSLVLRIAAFRGKIRKAELLKAATAGNAR